MNWIYNSLNMNHHGCSRSLTGFSSSCCLDAFMLYIIDDDDDVRLLVCRSVCNTAAPLHTLKWSSHTNNIRFHATSSTLGLIRWRLVQIIYSFQIWYCIQQKCTSVTIEWIQCPGIRTGGGVICRHSKTRSRVIRHNKNVGGIRTQSRKKQMFKNLHTFSSAILSVCVWRFSTGRSSILLQPAGEG